MSDSAPPPEEGQRLAPLGLIAGFVGNLPQLFFPILAALFGTRGSDLGAVPVIAAVLLGSLAFRWLGWRRFRYWLGEDEVRIERGLLSRTARSIPYERIADVGLEQKPLARMLGLCEVKFETGGGKGEDASLSYVSLAEAARLRDVVRARKSATATADEAEAAPDEQAAPLFAMDNRRLVTLGLYSFSLIAFAVLAGAAQQFDFLLPFDLWDWEHWLGAAESQGLDVTDIGRSAQLTGAALALAALIATGFGTGIVRTFLAHYGFRLDRTAKGFRRRSGLLTRSEVTMPVERVQAAILATGPFRQRGGWHALRFVSLASESSKLPNHTMAPLAQLAEIAPILAEARLHLPGEDARFVRPPLGPWLDDALIAAAGCLAIAAIAAQFAGPPGWLFALLAVPLALVSWWDWQHRAHALDADQLFARHNWWNRQLDLARQVNVQSVTLSHGPLLGLRGLARIEFGIAGGTLALAAVPLAEAMAIRNRVLEQAAPVDFARLGLRG